jgi:acetyl esterase/lipase
MPKIHEHVINVETGSSEPIGPVAAEYKLPMTGDVLSRRSRPPDLVLQYGDRVDQVADLRLPADLGPRSSEPGIPLVIFFHGGFWRAAYDRSHTGPLAEGLTAAGLAVCAPEYRRTGQRGGGWPGTFDDVALAVDALPGLVALATGGLAGSGPVVLAGHSAGGHLALWAAARHRLSPDTGWQAAVAVSGVVSLAGVSELAECFRRRLGRGAAKALMGGGPDRHPDRYAAADPVALLPSGQPTWLVHGTADNNVPVSFSQHYAARAEAAGDRVTLTVLPGIGHFELIDPLSSAWPAVLAAFLAATGPSPAS